MTDTDIRIQTLEDRLRELEARLTAVERPPVRDTGVTALPASDGLVEWLKANPVLAVLVTVAMLVLASHVAG